MMEFEPPLVGCIMSSRNYSHATFRKSRECVINIPDASLAKKVIGCGNASARRTEKFAAFGLTPVRASLVAAPLIAECWASLECRVIDTRMVSR